MPDDFPNQTGESVVVPGAVESDEGGPVRAPEAPSTDGDQLTDDGAVGNGAAGASSGSGGSGGTGGGSAPDAGAPEADAGP